MTRLASRGDRATASAPGPRSELRSVALPTEHGGWSLTLEPVALGLAIAWSWEGLLLGLCALLAFLVRTPVKVVLVDLWRRRRRARTSLAARVALAEIVVLGALASIAVAVAAHTFWLPILSAVPLLAVELWFDMRSRSRRLLPELAGTVGIGSVGAAIVLAGTGDALIAGGVWCVVSARAVASIPYVRTQLQRSHGLPPRRRYSDLAQMTAVVIVVVAFVVEMLPALPVVVIGAVVTVNLVGVRRPPRPAVVIGVQQMLIGFGVVAASALSITAA